ncbi:phosphatase PAP2 family protein [Neolewinella litorea]|uniref:Phosphatase PAP2 family protein n=1 Tax=Neolewinella litorea TaxID=2562452 RepID=A0A4S4NJI8_9BACT|nr:phosphatase PAP2 family protein [Neolewinella litorea]THH39942.1 phosphatase PAP2 family protein [Neolewinella litorea]
MYRVITQLFLALALLVGQVLPGQGLQPYNPGNATNAALLGLGGTLTTTSIMLDRRVVGLTEEDISVLEINKIPGIDMYSTRNLSLVADEATDKLLLASFASPFFLLLDRPGRENFDEMALIVFEGAMINSGLINLTKVLVRRPRPYNYNLDAPLDTKLTKSSRYSFFSGHSATTAYFSITTAKLYNDLYPESKAKPYVWLGAALLPAAVSYGRMRAGRHFFTDVLVGSAVGTIIALVVPTLHKSGAEN